jgi:Bacteriophage head to tail connecting protein
MQDKQKETTPALVEADKKAHEALLRVVMDDFTTARKYVKDNYQGVWDDCFKAYNGIRTRRGYSGVADDFVPETFSIVESLKSSIAGTKPKFKYMPLTEEQEQDTSVLNSLVDFYWSYNNMTEKLLNWVGDMIVYGNGVFMVSWKDDKPMIQHIPLSDFFVDPSSTHLNRPEEPGYARYAGYRYLTSVDSLKAQMVPNVDTGEMEPLYKNLDNITALSGEDDQMDKDRKEKSLGSVYGKDSIKKEVEVIEYYTRKKKIVIANRQTIIFDDKNPFQRAEEAVDTQMMVNNEIVPGKRVIPEIQGFLPFAILRNYVDSNLFFARGDVEVILPSQEALNDTASQKRDNVAYSLNNMWQIDPRFKHLADQIESMPGAVFPIPKGALTPIEKQDVSPAADSEIERLRQQMRSATAADAAVQGTAQKYSRTTATEVAAQLNQASTRFTTKVQTLEDEGFAQLARIIYKMIQIFVTQPIAVRMIGNEGASWKDYKPGTYVGEYEPRVVLEATAKAEANAIAQQMQVAAQFSINNPLVNQAVFLRKMYESLFPDMPKDEINELLSPPAPPMMGPDGQAIDPALAQGNAQVTPAAAEALKGADATDTTTPRNGYSRFGGTDRGRMTQTGGQGGGGADSSSNNIRRTRSAQPSTKLDASSKPQLNR